MPRRIVVILALLAALAIAGCGYGTPARLTAEQRQARLALIEDHPTFDDPDLARLCPGLYPRAFLRDTDTYPEGERERGDRVARITAQDRADAAAAGCDVHP
jgi:hypothetical protein